jgi:hypothetical protein
MVRYRPRLKRRSATLRHAGHFPEPPVAVTTRAYHGQAKSTAPTPHCRPVRIVRVVFDAGRMCQQMLDRDVHTLVRKCRNVLANVVAERAESVKT